MSQSNSNNQEDLQKKLGELGEVIHNKLSESGRDTSQADDTIKGIQNFISESHTKVENADDKDKAQKDIAQNLLEKFEQYTGKGETNQKNN